MMNRSCDRGSAKPHQDSVLTGTGAIIICWAIVCLILTTASWTARISAAEVPSDTDVLAIAQKHCVPCHAAEPTHEAFAKPPAGIMLETIEQIRRYAPRILDQVTVTRAMPLGNQTGMTDEERDRVAAWIEGRK